MKAEEVVDGRAQYFAVAEPAFGATRDAQEEGRALQREGHDAISGFTLGDRFVALRKPVPTADRVATFPLTAFQTWHAARYQRAEWVRDLADYAQPFLRRGIPVSDFITFWLDELDAHELPRALCAHIIAEEQLNAKIGHGNAQDQIHAAYAIDADLLVTADRAFFDALRALPAVVPRAASAVS